VRGSAAPAGRAVKVEVQLGMKDAARAWSTCFHLADREATIVSTSLRNEAAGRCHGSVGAIHSLSLSPSPCIIVPAITISCHP
jgi:hypothetical protein